MRYPIVALLAFVSLFFFSGKSHATGTLPEIQVSYQDSTSYQSFHGIIVDSRTKNPIIFANIFLRGTNIGTVSNSEGEFLIKVPMFIENKVIEISSVGYKNFQIHIDQLQPEDNEIIMEPNPIPIEGVATPILAVTGKASWGKTALDCAMGISDATS